MQNPIIKSSILVINPQGLPKQWFALVKPPDAQVDIELWLEKACFVEYQNYGRVPFAIVNGDIDNHLYKHKLASNLYATHHRDHETWIEDATIILLNPLLIDKLPSSLMDPQSAYEVDNWWIDYNFQLRIIDL